MNRTFLLFLLISFILVMPISYAGTVTTMPPKIMWEAEKLGTLQECDAKIYLRATNFCNKTEYKIFTEGMPESLFFIVPLELSKGEYLVTLYSIIPNEEQYQNKEYQFLIGIRTEGGCSEIEHAISTKIIVKTSPIHRHLGLIALFGGICIVGITAVIFVERRHEK